uniref:Protein krueppel n=2 Tax=Photinus pyralis TaxID=7054 RepID=A0A1Y1LHH7_PHOPY
MIWGTSLCRICAQIRNICIPIFQKDADIGIDIKIKRCLALNISQDDLKPRQVCQECLIKLNDFYNFVVLYTESDHRFETLLCGSTGGDSFSQQVMDLDYTIITPTHCGKSDGITHLGLMDQCKEIDPFIDVEAPDVEQNLLNEIVAKVVDDSVEIDLQNLVAADAGIYANIANIPQPITSCPVMPTEAVVPKPKQAKAKIISVQTLCERYEIRQPQYEKAHVPKPKLAKNTYPCIKCGKIFTRRRCLNEHFKKHSDSRPFTCDLCGKGFMLQSDLTCHKLVHTDLFGCKYCGKRFTAPSKLQRHVRTHTGEKPFRCDVKDCGRSFSDKCNLIGHQLTHSNVRNFTCDICKQAYKTKNQLKNHLQAHSEVPIYKCNVCGKLYRWRTNLVNHVKTHGDKEISTKVS